MFKKGDIVTIDVNDLFYDIKKGDKALVLSQTNDMFYCKLLTGQHKGSRLYFSESELKYVCAFKQKSFESGDIVYLVHPVVDMSLKNSKFTFVSYLQSPYLLKDHENVLMDCVLMNEDGKHKFSSSIALEYEPDLPKPKEESNTPLLTITQKDNEIIVTHKNGTTAKAKCCAEDVFDEQTGVMLALARLYNNKFLEFFFAHEPKYIPKQNLDSLIYGLEFLNNLNKNAKQSK